MNTVAPFSLGNDTTVSPAIWPGRELKIQPGDLSLFTPHGNGVYGYQGRGGEDPIKAAPPQDNTGGAVYFGNGASLEDFAALLRLMGVQQDNKAYAVFIQESTEPRKDGCLVQMRIATNFALRFMFGAINDVEYDSVNTQVLTVQQTLWRFIETEKARWGTSFGAPRLAGLFGGDGHFGQEELSFGFMVENSYHGVFRIWSRAWIVTK